MKKQQQNFQIKAHAEILLFQFLTVTADAMGIFYVQILYSLFSID